MHEDNPYEPPHTTSAAGPSGATIRTAVSGVTHESAAVSTESTVLPRYIAAILDNVFAIGLSVPAAKTVSEELPLVQFLVFVATYLGYYLLFEGVVSRTPGKFLMGLLVVQVDGARCTWRQSLIRTCFRVLEVNPGLLGALPAAVSIIVSRNHQRIGDMFAGTVVVLTRRMRRSR